MIQSECMIYVCLGHSLNATPVGVCSDLVSLASPRKWPEQEQDAQSMTNVLPFLWSEKHLRNPRLCGAVSIVELDVEQNTNLTASPAMTTGRKVGPAQRWSTVVTNSGWVRTRRWPLWTLGGASYLQQWWLRLHCGIWHLAKGMVPRQTELLLWEVQTWMPQGLESASGALRAPLVQWLVPLGHHVWATHKSHHSHHHGPIKYDCVTDYEHWQVSWSSKRAKFCCWAASWCLLRTGCDLCAGNSIERKQNLHSCSMSIWTVVHAFPQLIDWRVWEIWWTAFILFRCWVQSWKNVKPELLWFLCLLNFLEKVARTWQRELQVNNTWAQSTKCLETDIEARSKN